MYNRERSLQFEGSISHSTFDYNVMYFISEYEHSHIHIDDVAHLPVKIYPYTRLTELASCLPQLYNIRKNENVGNTYKVFEQNRET